MLAAIGVGILAKQFHVMLGFTDVKGNTINQLVLIPNSIKNLLSNPSSDIILASFAIFWIWQIYAPNFAGLLSVELSQIALAMTCAPK